MQVDAPAPAAERDMAHMRRALDIARRAQSDRGLQPFGAVVVLDGRIVGEGVNAAAGTFDPTSHGEIEAIRDACRNLGTLSLAGATIYATCEPCPLCVAACVIAGIERIVHATSIDEAIGLLDAVPAQDFPPIDVDLVRRQAGRKVGADGFPACRCLAAEGAELLRAWGARQTP